MLNSLFMNLEYFKYFANFQNTKYKINPNIKPVKPTKPSQAKYNLMKPNTPKLSQAKNEPIKPSR